MVVYAEDLFLENFITGLILLYLTARMTMLRNEALPPFWRILLGGILCGCSGFFLFLPVNYGAALLLRGIAAFSVCLTVFGGRSVLKRTAFFLFISFFSGGMAMAFFLWRQIPAMAANGILYLESMTYAMLVSCGLPALAGTWWMISLLRRHRAMNLAAGEVELELDGKCCRLTAWIDSGNCLREPISGSPVILVDTRGSRRLPFTREEYGHRLVAVPYQTVGVEKGILMGIRLDRMRYGEYESGSVVLAWYEGQFDGFEVLLNRELLEGGVLDA